MVGLGLLGGSLGLVFRKRLGGFRVLGLSRSQSKIRCARAIGAIDWGSTKPREVLSQADLVFICTPVSAIPFWIQQSEQYANPGTLVTDVGSTKREIIKWAESKRFRNIDFVGSHPMAGSHNSGIEFAKAGLFEDSLTFVIRTPETRLPALREMTALWRRISAKVVVVDPARHDQIVAAISHAPHALASLLVLNVPERFLSYSAAGFLDTTRISQGDPALWRDVFLSNRSYLAESLRHAKGSIGKLIGDLARSDGGRIFRCLRKARRIRVRLGKNKF